MDAHWIAATVLATPIVIGAVVAVWIGARVAATFVRYWHLADIAAAPPNVRYWRHSGHWLALALNGSVVNDP